MISYTPLHLAANKGNLNIVEFLVINGADIHTKNNIVALSWFCILIFTLLQIKAA